MKLIALAYIVKNKIIGIFYLDFSYIKNTFFSKYFFLSI